MEQAGYTEADGLEDVGREDLSYLLRFVYRLDGVPNFDSESIGNSEHTFKHLDLQGRNLEMVPIFLYRHADWIVSLDLSANPMSDLPLDFIQLCTGLRTLRLSNLALKRIPQSVRHSETLTHFDVSNNRIPDLSHVALDNMQELLSIKIQNNRLYELPSYFSRIETLRYLNVSNNRFEIFPSVVCEMPSLVDLDFSFNAIASLPAELRQLVKLERLVLVGNSLDTLPDCMSELVSLHTIDLRRNLIQEVSPLFGLPKLKVVQCEHNSIKSFEAAFGAHLRTLEVGHNPLSTVRLGARIPSELTLLNLSSANMAKLDEDLLTQLPYLTELILDRNQFLTLPDALGELKNLTRLSCSNNNLAALPDSIGRLEKLRRLDVQNNNLKMLPSAIWNCVGLSSINVSSNLLESFPSPPLAAPVESSEPPQTSAIPPQNQAGVGTIESERKGSVGSLGASGLPSSSKILPLTSSLKKLRLGDNRLTDDVFNILELLASLEVLNLSFNEIYEIPNFSLSKNGQLRELYLSGNNLSSIPADDLEHLDQLRILHLNGNKLQTLPAELGRMQNLVNLDVGNNVLKYNIANWHYDWHWKSNPNLRYLNLSGNKRFEIKSIEDGVRRRNVSDFGRLSQLRVLGLMDVTMTTPSAEKSMPIPDETENRRVRTSFSQINGMAYGVADALGVYDNLSIVDVVTPNFRKRDNECLFGMFEGRGHGSNVGSRIAKHLAEWCNYRIEWEIRELARSQRLQSLGTKEVLPTAAQVPDVMRRAFLRLGKEYADMLMNEGHRKLSQAQAVAANDESKHAAPAIASASNRNHWKAGASGVLVYIVDKTLYVANAGDALAVLSRNGGTAHLVSTKHEPFDREETQRIRSAEGWVSLRGYVNDVLDVSRSFGYYHLSPVVNAAPAVTTVHLTDSDEFVILANRVLWDHISYQTAVDIARMERDDPMIAAQKLRDFAISYGAEESILIMVVAVSDLFFKRQRSDAMPYDQPGDAFKKAANRRGREELPGDRTLARLEREVAPPIGHVALVFTDIKNSTSLWETNGGMHAAMRLHNYLLRRQLRTIGGYEVKTEGDAFMVSFPSVTSALLWCFTVQLQLLREDWPVEILESEDGKEVLDSSGELVARGLSVRMGIHWGVPVCEADPITRRMDYFGPIVNRAARISGAADGGQIMASRDVVNELTALLGTFKQENGEEESEAPGGPEEVDEDTFRMMNPNVSRDVVLLRRMGFGISEVGERRMKGLETPEFLHLVYPKQLAGRLEAKPDAPAPQVFEPTLQLLDIDEVKQIGMLCLRIEALTNDKVFPGIERPEAAIAAATANEHGTESGELMSAMEPSHSHSSAGASSTAIATRSRNSTEIEAAPRSSTSTLNPTASPALRRKAVEATLALHPELLIYAIRDDATDDELAGILEQLVTRITNALNTLTMKKLLGSQFNLAEMDLSQIIQALGQATSRIEEI